jgi:ATP phosphoribosyltransferase
MTHAQPKLIFAIPKGRILDEVLPILEQANLKPRKDFFDKKSRALRFETENPHIDLIRVRAFDVASFVAFGGAHIGIVGKDVLDEFQYADIYAPLDLKIGRCRLSVAMLEQDAADDNPKRWSHIRVATKYPHLTEKHFHARGVQIEAIKLNGAMELAPSLGLAKRIVDLVSSGATLKANGLVEVEQILDITSYLIVNRIAYKTQMDQIEPLIQKFKKIVG